MKVALAQINTTLGDFEGTLFKIKKCVAQAKQQKSDLIAFPELTLTGYPPRDLLDLKEFIDQNLRALKQVARWAKGICIVVGYVETNPSGKGKPLWNAAAFCENGKIQRCHHKVLLPTYDVFDEARHFEPGQKIEIHSFKTNNGKKAKVAISICEDAWNNITDKKNYPRDPIEEQASQKPDFFLNLSASPYAFQKDDTRRQMFCQIAKKYKKPLCMVNLVGGNDELVFDGRSLVVNAYGEILSEAKAYEEDMLIVDLEEPMHSRQKQKKERNANLDALFEALVLGTRDYVQKCGFKKVILGLSGGIDSALTALIAAKALGPENVTGVAMPSPYSSEGSIRDAKLLAKKLKIRFEEFPIHKVYDSYRKIFGRKPETTPDLADENTQARIRGNILMTLSNRYGGLVLSTGNKSELAVGYCTLYGDMSGGLAVISDLFKTQVYALAFHLQKKMGVFPEDTLHKPPSAELRPNQKDEDSLPPYSELDPILEAILEQNKSAAQIIRMGFDAGTVKRILKMVRQNEYKRRQAAPGIKVSSKAFGMGRRYPIARKI